MAEVETTPARESSNPGGGERLDAPAREEKRITALFRRWPALDDREARELRRLWDERMHRAKHDVG
jgi:hypothetical protein